jgi:hypothetical protein
MLELIFAGLGLVVCVALLVRMVLPERHRWTVDHHARRAWLALQGAGHRLWHWRGQRRNAAREADAAIRRARGEATREGNVIRPKSFDKPRKPH